MEHLYGEERVRERGLFSLEKRQLLRHPTAAPRTYREASKEMDPGTSQWCTAGKQELVALS